MTLPEGWRVAPLGDVAETALGKMLDRGRTRGLPEVRYLRNVNVQWGRVDTHDLQTMELADDERDRFGVEPGDVLVCEGGEIGRAAIWHGDGQYIAFQKALHRLRPHTELDSGYLRYVLEWRAVDGTLQRFATGSTIAHLPQQQLRLVPIPLPPLGEQLRVVDRLEEHLSRLEAAERACRAALRRLDAIGDAALSSEPTLEKADRVEVRNLITEPLANGRSVKDRSDGFPVLRLTAITGERFDSAARKRGDWSEAEARRFLASEGDFLCARGNGSLKLVGRGVVVRDIGDPVAFPDTMIRIRVDPARLTVDYLDTLWRSADVRRQIEASARTTAGIYKVNQRDLGGIVLPIVPLAEQGRMVARLSSLTAARRELQKSLTGVIAHGTALRRALLEAAFSGRLTSHTSDMNRGEEVAIA